MSLQKFSYEDILDNLIKEEEELQTKVADERAKGLSSFSQQRLKQVRRQILDCRRYLDKRLK